MSGSPFFIIPWDKDFLECLSNIIIKETHGQIGSAFVVFTHDRPRKYLVQCLQNHPEIQKPCLLPQMLTIQELWVKLSGFVDTRIWCEISLLEQVFILFSCVQKCSFTAPSMLDVFSKIEMADFFPWGVHLAGLIEECLVQGIEPENLLYTEGEVEPFAAALLGVLGQIYFLYKDYLISNHKITPGLKAFLLVNVLYQKGKDIVTFFEQKKLFFAGFSKLSKTEDILFRYLWEHGAYVCLHVDTEVAIRPKEAHWACESQIQWIQSWKADTELVCSTVPVNKNWHFFSGYDLHSQLEILNDDLQALDQSQKSSMAVILTHSNLLLPVLHHLPDKQCNISLGYPFNNSLLFRLLDLVVHIRDSCQEDGSVYYRVLLDLLRHPYLRLLEEDSIPLRESLQNLEQQILKGSRYIHVSTLLMYLEEYNDNDFNAHNVLLKSIIKTFVSECLDIQTLSKFAEILSVICEMLLMYSGNMWKQFPLDAECLFRLIHQIIPNLKNNSMSDRVLPWELIKSMWYTLIHAERVPFEAEHLIGLQVLGMLETRLLQFSKVFIIDATDDHLPGAPVRNPLLPDTLRNMIGLPDIKCRDLLTAYTFYRLIAGAKDVYIYWQEGIEVSGIFDGKKQHSRFVEEILWQEEQRIGERISSNNNYIRVPNLDIQPPKKECRSVAKTQLIQDRLMMLLGKPISATFLDSYLFCPLYFYFERLCSIQSMKYLCEEDNHLAVGQLLHKVLNLYYKDYIGKVCYKKDLSVSLLKNLFFDELNNSRLMDTLPPESAVMLKISGLEKLKEFLDKQPDKTEIIHIEQHFQTMVSIHGKNRIFEGVLDRVDRRENKTVILDYKTGLLKKNTDSLWRDDELWSLLASDNCISSIKSGSFNNILQIILKKLPSIQLPYYMYLYSYATGEDVHDAAYISLRENGEEFWLLRGLATDIKEDKIFECISNLLHFLLLHMEYCTEFNPHEGKHCLWCSWNTICKI